jgi:predicted membrane-bound spermidine synthase
MIQPLDAAARIVLRKRKDHLEIVAGNVVLLSSAALETELAFGRLAAGLLPALAERAGRPPARVLVGGLGFGATLRGVLDVVPAGARVVVVEKVNAVVDLVRGSLAHMANRPLDDPRVELVAGDVGEVVADEGSFDVLLLDVDNGPHWATFRHNARLYSPAGLAAFRRALVPGGAMAVWSGYPADAFCGRLREAGFDPSIVPLAERGVTRARAYVGRVRP